MEEIIETTTEQLPEVPYGDLYLKFADEAQSIEVLEGYEGSIDVIGVIYLIDNTDPENPVSTASEGWHVNTRGPLSEKLKAFSVIPSNPRRVWA